MNHLLVLPLSLQLELELGPLFLLLSKLLLQAGHGLTNRSSSYFPMSKGIVSQAVLWIHN
jgi:hypothetical protein